MTKFISTTVILQLVVVYGCTCNAAVVSVHHKEKPDASQNIAPQRPQQQQTTSSVKILGEFPLFVNVDKLLPCGGQQFVGPSATRFFPINFPSFNFPSFPPFGQQFGQSFWTGSFGGQQGGQGSRRPGGPPQRPPQQPFGSFGNGRRPPPPPPSSGPVSVSLSGSFLVDEPDNLCRPQNTESLPICPVVSSNEWGRTRARRDLPMMFTGKKGGKTLVEESIASSSGSEVAEGAQSETAAGGETEISETISGSQVAQIPESSSSIVSSSSTSSQTSDLSSGSGDVKPVAVAVDASASGASGNKPVSTGSGTVTKPTQELAGGKYRIKVVLCKSASVMSSPLSNITLPATTVAPSANASAAVNCPNGQLAYAKPGQSTPYTCVIGQLFQCPNGYACTNTGSGAVTRNNCCPFDFGRCQRDQSMPYIPIYSVIAHQCTTTVQTTCPMNYACEFSSTNQPVCCLTRTTRTGIFSSSHFESMEP